MALPNVPRGSWTTLTLRLTGRAVVRPRLALDLLTASWAFRRRGWWSRPPFLPLPDPTYLRWRMYTAYGDPDAVPSARDVERFARWRRQILRLGH
ncbi:MAG: hypothetical protein JF590_07385 [Gemmatimonadetes bacterium]|nr:hypothetical protein [Gemmatimonadota bacterium]